MLERYDAFARVPWVRTLSVHAFHNAEVRDFLSRPWSPRWVEVELQTHPTGLEIEDDSDNTLVFLAIAKCPQVAQLRRLHLSVYSVMAVGVQALAESPHLDRLEQLRLSFVDEGVVERLRARFGDRLVIG